MTNYTDTIGKRIKTLRKYRNVTQKQLAEWSDISGINYHTLTWRINNRKTCILIPQSTNE